MLVLPELPVPVGAGVPVLLELPGLVGADVPALVGAGVLVLPGDGVGVAAGVGLAVGAGGTEMSQALFVLETDCWSSPDFTCRALGFGDRVPSMAMLKYLLPVTILVSLTVTVIGLLNWTTY